MGKTRLSNDKNQNLRIFQFRFIKLKWSFHTLSQIFPLYFILEAGEVGKKIQQDQTGSQNPNHERIPPVQETIETRYLYEREEEEM